MDRTLTIITLGAVLLRSQIDLAPGGMAVLVKYDSETFKNDTP